MKVCLVVDNLNIHNGGGRFAHEFVASFSNSDITFEIISFKPLDKPFPVPVTTLIPRWWRILFNAYKIRSVIKRSDIVHSFDFYPNAFLSALALLGIRKKHVITTIGTCSVGPLYRMPHLLLIKSFIYSVDAIVSISTYTAEKIREKLPTLPISVIPPFSFMRPKTGDEPPSVDFVKRLEKVSPYIISVLSSLKPRKGCFENLRVFARLAERFPSLHYLIVAKPSESEYSQSIITEIDRLGLTDRVHFFGDLSEAELSHAYANATMHLMLSRYDKKEHDIEGFGLVYLESASHGVPSVGNYDSGARDAIAEGVSGILVRAKNDNELIDMAYQATLQLLQHGNRSTKEGAKAFSRSFSAKKSTDAYTAIYRSVMEMN